MSDGQELALWAMLVVGIPGMAVATTRENSKKLRISGAVWVVFWWLPPLTLVWTKGVFG